MPVNWKLWEIKLLKHSFISSVGLSWKVNALAIYLEQANQPVWSTLGIIPCQVHIDLSKISYK